MNTRNLPQWTVTADEQGLRLDQFLATPERIGSRGRVIAALERGKIFINDVEASVAVAGSRVRQGDVVRVWMDRPGSSRRRHGTLESGDLQILYEDESLLVLNKPAGLLAVPLERREAAPSVYDHIEDHLRSRGKRRPFIVHRIDRDTSGLVVFAKTARAQQALKDQFRRREPERVYWALVYGHPDPAQGTWRDRLVWDQKALIQKETSPNDPKGAEAISDYRVLESFAETSLIEVRLQTGKRNQIRIQARLRGHTLVGEKRYVFGPGEIRPLVFPRQALHAYRLAFRHPSDDRQLHFEAPLPADFDGLLTRVRKTRRPESRQRP
ncbi:MAG TPA: RluA family pseudouridine synthase [Vicinamibacterales bacterium]|nr:RluA family pseudouridine synthase [Vicinamibacterales bacterium]